MRKIKLFLYDHAPPHVHDSIPAYRNSVPFSEEGIAQWCELVDPKDAELFYCGQYADKDRWMLNPERFEHFKGNEHRHVFDLEGDQSQLSFLPWMRPCIITAMNAEPNHRNWNCFVRPGCSTLLMDMVKNPRPFQPPKQVGFYFRGQRDPNGLREKVREAFLQSGVPGEWQWTDKWNAPSILSDPDVSQYEAGMKHWSFALCPAGTGQMTVRFFEACGFGRIPVVIADNYLFEDRLSLPFQRGSNSSVEQLVRIMKHLTASYKPELSAHHAAIFVSRIVKYFHDPTLYFLASAHKGGMIEAKDLFLHFIEQRNED